MVTAPIGIIGAMDSEVALLKENMQDLRVEKHAGSEFFCGTLRGVPVVVEKCGIGKVCAAMGTQAMIDHFDVCCVINTGVAGGLAKGLNVGDLVVSSDVVQHDYDLTAFGYAKGYLADVGTDKTCATRILADATMKECFRKAAEKTLTDTAWIEGTIVSGDVFVNSSELKNTLIEQFQASAAEMEGAAVGEVAYLNGKPFLVIRALSDLADQEATVSYEEFEKKAARVSAGLVMEMCELLNA